MVKIVIREELYIRGLTLDCFESLMADNTIKNPKRASLLAMFKSYLEPGAGDNIPNEAAKRAFKAKARKIKFMVQAEPETIVLWRSKEDWLALPRGCFAAVIVKLREAGETFEVEDRTVCPEAPLIEEVGTLYDYQAVALDSLLRYPTGMLEGPTGSGKGSVLLSAAARLETNVLIIVHTTELLNQTVARAKDWLGIEAGHIGGGRKDRLEQITVAMVQTLMRRDLEHDPIHDFFGAIILDESHHVSAPSFSKVFRAMPARYKYGFTATAFRKDQMQFMFWKIIGGLTAKIDKKTVLDAGKIVWPRIEHVLTDFWFDAADSSDWGKMITELAADDKRNQLICDQVHARLQDNRALILTDRIEHANTLARMLAHLDPVLLTGEVSKGERATRMEAIRAGARRTIATVHLMGEGIDVPSWSLLFLVSPVSGGPRTLQAMGRIARPSPGKTEAVLVDFVDARVKLLKGAAAARAKLYKGKR